MKCHINMFRKFLDTCPSNFSSRVRGMNMAFVPPFGSNSFYSFGILEHFYEDLIGFTHKSISEVRYSCWMISSGSPTPLQLIPKVLDGAPSLQRTQFHCSTAQYWGGPLYAPNRHFFTRLDMATSHVRLLQSIPFYWQCILRKIIQAAHLSTCLSNGGTLK